MLNLIKDIDQVEDTEYICQTTSKKTMRLCKKQIMKMIETPGFGTKEEIIDRGLFRLRSKIYKKPEISNLIRTTLLLNIDSESQNIRSSKFKINSRTYQDTLACLDSYEIKISNPLENGTPTWFYIRQTSSETGGSLKNSANMNDKSEDQSYNSCVVKKLKRKTTISKIKCKELDGLSIPCSKNIVKTITANSTKDDLIVQGCQYLQKLASNFKLSFRKHTTFKSETNIRSFKAPENNGIELYSKSNKDIPYNQYSCRHKSTIQSDIDNDDSLPMTHCNSSSIQSEGDDPVKKKLNYNLLKNVKETKQSSFKAEPSQQAYLKGEISLTDYNMKPSESDESYECNNLDERNNDRNVVILYHGREMEVGNNDKLSQRIINNGICLLNKKKKLKTTKPVMNS